jgi:hypothetical protein
MDGCNDVATERNYARLKFMMEKYPDFFAQKEKIECYTFPSAYDYVLWLCDMLMEYPQRKNELLLKIQENVNLNKKVFRVDKNQSVGEALGVVAALINHNLLLSSYVGTKENRCKKILVCQQRDEQEMCKHYKDQEDAEDEFFRCKFFKMKTSECLCADAKTEAEQSA